MKPYYVEMAVKAVVMADNEADALMQGRARASEIVRDQGADPQQSTLLQSLAHLTSLDSSWSGRCLPYGGDVALSELLPATLAPRDTRTIDMFHDQMIS